MKSNDNVSILTKLGYYNININAVKIGFILECTNYLLYAHDINFNEIYTFGFDDWFLDMDSVEELYVKFEKICTDEKKNKMDFTINEIITFIKKSDIYIKIEQDLGFKLKRAIMLSKYTNSITSDKLINALTLEELNILSN